MKKLLDEIRAYLCVSYVQQPYNEQIDRLLADCLSSGIANFRHSISISGEHFYSIVEFKNQITYEFWDCNKYYSWIYRGEFRKYNFVIARYNELRLSRLTMYRFKKQLKPFIKKLKGREMKERFKVNTAR